MNEKTLDELTQEELEMLNNIRSVTNIIEASLSQLKYGVVTREQLDDIEEQCTYQFYKVWCKYYEYKQARKKVGKA